MHFSVSVSRLPPRIAGLLFVSSMLALGLPGSAPAAVTVGATSGSHQVTPSGAFTYTIPIAVPPGTAGIEPKLSLNYNSQGGNGLLGMGWSLSGLSVIHRCPKTVVQDGVHGSVNYNANDRYCLDGQRLVAINGTYGADASEYRTESESYSLSSATAARAVVLPGGKSGPRAARSSNTATPLILGSKPKARPKSCCGA